MRSRPSIARPFLMLLMTTSTCSLNLSSESTVNPRNLWEATFSTITHVQGSTRLQSILWILISISPFFLWKAMNSVFHNYDDIFLLKHAIRFKAMWVCKMVVSPLRISCANQYVLFYWKNWIVILFRTETMQCSAIVHNLVRSSYLQINNHMPTNLRWWIFSPLG